MASNSFKVDVYKRQADDFVVLGQSAASVRAALADAGAALQALRLELHPGKTRLADFDSGFVFLGVRFVHRVAETVDPAAARWLTEVTRPADCGGSAKSNATPRQFTAEGRELRSICLLYTSPGSGAWGPSSPS